MTWYYVENGEQRGPVTDTDLELLVKAGTVKPETLVWREGMANWQAYRDTRPPAPGAAPAPFAAQSASGMATEAQVRERDYEHDIGSYLSQAWRLVMADLGSVVGATALVGLCLLMANGIPYLSMITGILFTGPLLGGLFVFFLKKIRSQSAELGDAFSGFGPRFGQLLIANFVPGLLSMLALIPAIVVAFVVIAMAAAARNHGATGGMHLNGTLIAAGVIAIAGGCVTIYLQTCWVFTVWLVADKGITFWPAMSLSRAVVGKHWWQTFFLGVVTGMVVLAGALLCGVGLLLSAPVGIAMYAYGYEKLFGDLQPEN